MPGSVQVSGDTKRSEAEQVPALVQRHSWVPCGMLIQRKYISSYSELHLEPLATKFLWMSEVMTGWGFIVLPVKISLCKDVQSVMVKAQGPHGTTKPVYIPSSCLNLGTWAKGARLLTEQSQGSRSGLVEEPR